MEKAKKVAKEVVEEVKDKAEDVVDKTEDVVENITEGAEETVENITEGVEETVENIKNEVNLDEVFKAEEVKKKIQWRKVAKNFLIGLGLVGVGVGSKLAYDSYSEKKKVKSEQYAEEVRKFEEIIDMPREDEE